jgi:plasmid replication initiation protein
MIKNLLPQILKSKTPKVYKSKKLNKANFGDFNFSDYKVFLHLVSKIGGVDKYGKYLQPEQMQRNHVLTASEFSKIFNINIHNSYGFLKQAVDKLMKTDIRIEKPEEKGYWRINVCSQAEYNEDKGNIKIQFTDSIMPYLAQAKEKFILYNLKEIANFGSLYTTRLYELVQEFQDTGYMVKSVVQLREAFAVGNSFKLYSDFKKRTFGHACEEINSNYAMGLRFEEIKEGRKVAAVKFFFKKTKIHKVTHQHTGVSKNVYIKPEFLNKPKKNRTKKIVSDLENQLPKSLNNDPKSMKDVMSSFLTKLFPNKK